MAPSSHYSNPNAGYNSDSDYDSEFNRPSGGGFVEGTVVSQATGYTGSADMRRRAINNAHNQAAGGGEGKFRGSLFEEDKRDRAVLAARNLGVPAPRGNGSAGGPRYSQQQDAYGRNDGYGRHDDDRSMVASRAAMTVQPSGRDDRREAGGDNDSRSVASWVDDQASQHGAMARRSGGAALQYGGRDGGFDDDARTIRPSDSFSQAGSVAPSRAGTQAPSRYGGSYRR
ncbi:hypothetical protein BJY01DRAFT_255521 [Aspergillus pseudoustus]|uniref:Uncharacterized protein n=1 Tax=Aspergillus pseudoustus TaxID=1810923 RepID=A0ABR4IJD6_9EURO